MLLITFLSPLLMGVVAMALVIFARLARLPKPRVAFLVGRSVAYALIGVVASLLLTVGGMIWYESSTGYSAGNAPLGWIFFYGPLSAALGQFAALVQWWFKKDSVSECGDAPG